MRKPSPASYLLLCVLVSLTHAVRVFSENYIEGVYGRFFEFTQGGSTTPCPQIIDHFGRGNPSSLDNSWIVPHEKIKHDGKLCDDGGVLVLTEYDSKSELPSALQANPIAEETFNIMKKESTGFWLGTDARTCGSSVFPNPSHVFFVKEFENNIQSFFNLKLIAGRKYLFITSSTFTCIYEGLPRLTPSPTVVITNPNDPDINQEETDPTPQVTKTPTPSPSIVLSPTPDDENTDSTPSPSPLPAVTPVPSAPNDDDDGDDDNNDDNGGDGNDNDDGDDDDTTITDIADGATPKPTPTPNDDTTINDIADIDDDLLEEIEGGESLCFPGDANVELADGSISKMSKLSVGDNVRVGHDSFSTIFTFTHKMKSRVSLFIKLQTDRGESVRLTRGHMLYVNGKLKAAGEVQIGDKLRNVDGYQSTVTDTRTVVGRGIYNPQTIHGDIAVDGIIASTYTTTITATTAHSLLTPLRAVWNALQVNILRSSLESHSIPKTAMSLLSERFATLSVNEDL